MMIILYIWLTQIAIKNSTQMIILKKITSILLIFLCLNVFSQNRENTDLKKTVENIISTKKAKVGISIIRTGENKFIQINADEFFPMLSTVKFPIALKILNKVEKGEKILRRLLPISLKQLTIFI